MTSPFALDFHPSAADEATTAERWYRDRSETAAVRFRAELDRALNLIAEAPERWPIYDASTRRFLLRRFPFFVVYRQRGEQLTVIAVAHARRRPGYWVAR